MLFSVTNKKATGNKFNNLKVDAKNADAISDSK